MADERVITLRFKEGNSVDMELHQKLEQEKRELGISMPVYVKDVLRQYFEDNRKEKNADNVNKCLEQIRGIIREELSSLSAVIVGTMIRMIGNPAENIRRVDSEEQTVERESILPECSDELPEGLNSVLEQFL